MDSIYGRKYFDLKESKVSGLNMKEALIFMMMTEKRSTMKRGIIHLPGFLRDIVEPDFKDFFL